MEPLFHSLEETMMQPQPDMIFWHFSPPLPEPADHPDFILTPLEDPHPLPPPPPLPPGAGLDQVPRSSFVSYSRPSGGWQVPSACGEENIHKRVIGLLRRIPVGKGAKKMAGEGSRCFRHMMRERQRRENMSQSYADLHSMLAPRSKADKKSIVQCAAVHMQELKAVKEELQHRNEELRHRTEEPLLMRISEEEKKADADGAKIELRVENPSSPMESMIGALRCLKSMDVKANTIRFSFCGQELSALLGIETQMETAEVERAVKEVLMEVEKRFRSPFPGNNAGW